MSEAGVDAQRVRLARFNGTARAPEHCPPDENYWLLIGETGAIVAPANERGRVLVRFDRPVVSFGLHCHNAVPNTLLILQSDLAFLGPGE